MAVEEDKKGSSDGAGSNGGPRFIEIIFKGRSSMEVDAELLVQASPVLARRFGDALASVSAGQVGQIKMGEDDEPLWPSAAVRNLVRVLRIRGSFNAVFAEDDGAFPVCQWTCAYLLARQWEMAEALPWIAATARVYLGDLALVWKAEALIEGVMARSTGRLCRWSDLHRSRVLDLIYAWDEWAGTPDGDALACQPVEFAHALCFSAPRALLRHSREDIPSELREIIRV